MKIIKKIAKIVGIILAILALMIGFGYATLEINPFGHKPGKPVADIERKVEIWGEEVAGNHSGSKLDDMNIKGNPNKLLATLKFSANIVGEEYKDNEAAIDTFTYVHEIGGGYEKSTYEDEPYLIPYTMSDSDSAVIVIPGGGYGYKEMDGGTAEGKDIAESLNKAGINAFVLHYRSNPYEWPIPQLDVQRAVRYLRYHANDYGIHPDKIGLIGFSAGGFQTGSFINLIQGGSLFPDSYQLDVIDGVEDQVASAAMIYPALTYRYNVPMLFASFNDDDVRNPEERKELLDQTDLSKHFRTANIPQFIAYGTNDLAVGVKGPQEYIQSARAADADVTVIVAEGQNHGFKQEHYMSDYLEWVKKVFDSL
ncbi:alpha/beta hydrolase [Lysinibacillus parviboronicapiens]|uniref:alpha/beta hydrolase n=1 Tax=Lysinibacillus parviboronicapiens TaxID=436516 RepID=UPI000D3B8315|nr:alpha/beta hydrolase [Lysinibacillus parviboronicapiens]